ncbi:MAG: hypothetical protein QXF15_01605 [Candidatus Aenigmatarchaeota archaeon]|nr:hypothetical protein [Candidatus Aenigmarchaeota archaeon]
MTEVEMKEETLMTPATLIILIITILLGLFILLWFESGRSGAIVVSKIICGLISLFPFGNAMSILLKCPALTGG